MTSVLDPTDEVLVDPELELDEDGFEVGDDIRDDSGFRVPAARACLGVALSSLAAAVMVGGVFIGAEARVIACLTAVLGVAVAYGASRLRGAVTPNVALIVGVGVIGLAAMIPAGFATITDVSHYVSDAAKQGDILRPPLAFTPGWHAIEGWLLAAVGVSAAWTALVLQKPTAGLLIPLPLAAVAGISVPKDQQVACGVVIVVLFAAALGVVATGQLVGEEDERPSVGFQLRRAGRSLVVIALLSVVLVAASKQNFLFPKPAFNPASTAQLPKSVPPTNAPDRELFRVKSESVGPYRVGVLDVYDGKAWRFAPVADSDLKDVDTSGVVTPGVSTGVTADVTIKGYTGTAILPSLYRLVGVAAQGPRFSYDPRSDTVRVSQGQLQPGFRYQIASAALPQVTMLQNDVTPLDEKQKQFLKTNSEIPARLQPLLADVKRANKWDTFVALRQKVLTTVVASGPGVPKEVSPDRVTEMLLGTSHQGSPYEATAAIALMSRWVGIPSRIGFGFQADLKSKTADGFYPVRPRDAISYPEVYFEGFGWLPVTGLPEKAKANSANTNANKNTDVKASETFGAQLALPELTAPPSTTARVLAFVLTSVAGLALLGYLGYLLAPALRKLLVRSRRRSRARDLGPKAQIALAYAEFRDADTDLGYGFEADTPLAHLSRFAEDEEHKELAWLVTRALWGDLRDEVTPAMAAHAEELSRALRMRLSSAHPATLRFLAVFSRASLRHPYAPELVEWLSEKPKKEASRGLVAAPVPS
ncbi:MAG: transglutaminase-like enzyme/putative cysteine protease [Frankiales bacterium]|nr:transglutaminase-like enzyme/putative cysteine protease [Frankiales bacterium]